MGGHGRVHERLVIPVFVARGKLQVPVQEEPQVVGPAREDDALVGRGAGQDDLVGVQALLRPRRDALGRQCAAAETEERGDRQPAQVAGPPQLPPEDPRRPQSHGGVGQPDQQRGADQAQTRHQQQREQQ